MDYAIASDIGATNLRVGLVGVNGELKQKIQYNTPQNNPDEVVKTLLAAINQLDIKKKPVVGIGVGIGGFVDFAKGKIVYTPNFSFGGVYLKDILRKKYKLPSFVDNDANLAALGEKTYGIGKTANNMITLTLGTGIGGGIIINGKLFRGESSAAGEIGHMTIKMDDSLCSCGNTGDLESLAGGRALDNEARNEVKNNKDSLIYKMAEGRIDKVNGVLVTKAALRGDGLANKLLEKHAYRLAVGLANIVNIFDPEMIVLNGGLADAGNLLLAPAKTILRKRIFADSNRRIPRVVFGSLGSNAGLLGAGALVFEQL